MCQDKKADKPHKCCGNCRKDFGKSAPKTDTPAPQKPKSGDGVERPRICTPPKK